MSSGGPRTATGDMTLYGVYYAVVTQNKDEEKGIARIKVRLPWLDNGDKDQTFWAQLATPMSGDKFGWYTLPDIGDVVAVMFLAGDISQPIVLGGIWSKTDTPVEDNANGKDDFRGYRSRQGHKVILDDSSNGKVALVDKTNKNVAAVGAFGKPEYKPGIVVTITINKDVADDKFNGMYLVTGCTHRFTRASGGGGKGDGYMTVLRVARDAEKPK